MVILYSALSIPLALAMNGGRGPVVGTCGLCASLLMDCGRSARWMDGWMDGWMGLADQLLLLLLLRWLVCVWCANGPGLSVGWLSGSPLNVRLSLADIQCEWLAGRIETTIGLMDAGSDDSIGLAPR